MSGFSSGFKMAKDDPVLSVRVSQVLMDDMDELKPLVQRLPEYRGSTLNRSDLVRISLSHGVVRLRAMLAKRSDELEQVDLLEPPQQNLMDK